jgi:hypothetical protein
MNSTNSEKMKRFEPLLSIKSKKNLNDEPEPWDEENL